MLVFLYLAYRVVSWLLSDDTAASAPVQETAANLPAPAPVENTSVEQATAVETGVGVAGAVAETALDCDAVDVAGGAASSIFDLFT